MPIFISYSRRDIDFATRLAAQLVKHNARVWIDQWELRVGDSILDRIQSAIAGASALLVVLSKASVESEWCKKELSSGLLRELEEKRVVVLPVLIEDCEIPLFLRGKLYADFRTDFDQGLNSVLEAVARVTSESLGRIEEPEWHSDWAIDWGMLGRVFSLRVTIVEQAADQPFSALTELRFVANDIATRRYLEFERYDLGWLERSAIIQMLVDVTQQRDLFMILEDEMAKTMEIGIGDPRLGIRHHVTITARRLGEDTGKNILLNLGEQLRQIGEMQKRASRPLKTEDLAILKTIQKSFDPDWR